MRIFFIPAGAVAALEVSLHRPSVNRTDPSRRVVFVGRVTTEIDVLCEWSSDDVDLSSSARTMVSTPVSSPGAVLWLMLEANALEPSRTYRFTLTAGTVSSSLTVLTNDVPIGGDVVLAPESGTVLETLFSLTAVGWYDPDIPLVFDFGFQVDGFAMHLRTTTNASYDALLPRGTVAGTLVVRDSLGAAAPSVFSNATTVVKTNATNITGLALDLLEEARDLETMAQIAVAAASALDELAPEEDIDDAVDLIFEHLDFTTLLQRSEAASLAAATHALLTLAQNNTNAMALVEVTANTTFAHGGLGMDPITLVHLSKSVDLLVQGGAPALWTGDVLDVLGAATLVNGVVNESPSDFCETTFCVRSYRLDPGAIAGKCLMVPTGVGPGALVEAMTDADSLYGGDFLDAVLVDFGPFANRGFVGQLTSVVRVNFRLNGSPGADWKRRRLDDTSPVVFFTLQHTKPLIQDWNTTLNCTDRNDTVLIECPTANQTVDCAEYSSVVAPCVVEPKCKVWTSVDGYDDDICWLDSFTEDATTCHCSERYLGLASRSSEEESVSRSVECTTSAELVIRELASTFRQNPVSNIGKTAVVLYVLGGLALFFTCAALWGCVQDRLDAKASPVAVTVEDDDPGVTKETTVAAFSSSFPVTHDPWRTFLKRVWAQHPVLSFFHRYDPRYSRPLRAVALFCEYNWLLAAEGALFLLAFPDLGCDKYDIRSECHERSSPYFPTVKACTWHGSHRDPSCGPNGSAGAHLATYAVLLLLISMVVLPIGIVIDALAKTLALPRRSHDDDDIAEKRRRYPRQEDQPVDKPEGVVEAARDMSYPLETRVDALYGPLLEAVRRRQKVLIKQGNDSALVEFERTYGISQEQPWWWCSKKDDDFERRLRRKIRRDLIRADLYHGRMEDLGTDAEKTTYLGEIARIERLTLAEALIYHRMQNDNLRTQDFHSSQRLRVTHVSGKSTRAIDEQRRIYADDFFCQRRG